MFSWLSFRDVANLVLGWVDIGMPIQVSRYPL